MFNSSKQESVLCTINSYNEVSNTQLLCNILSGGHGLIAPNDFKLTLTNKYLYIEAKCCYPFSGVFRCDGINKISLHDIKDFDVISKKNEEYITLTLRDNRNMYFVKDNEKQDNLALYMSALIANL